MATKTRPTRIILKGGHGKFEEHRAGGAIRPGDLLTLTAAGTVIKHGTAGGPAEKMFAVEDALQGKGITENYATGDLVFCYIAEPGDVIFAFLSGGEHATPDEYLTSNGDGATKVAATTDTRIARPLEEVNASDSNDVDERIRARIL